MTFYWEHIVDTFSLQLYFSDFWSIQKIILTIGDNTLVVELWKYFA